MITIKEITETMKTVIESAQQYQEQLAELDDLGAACQAADLQLAIDRLNEFLGEE